MVECKDAVFKHKYAKVTFHYFNGLKQVKITFSRYFTVTSVKILIIYQYNKVSNSDDRRDAFRLQAELVSKLSNIAIKVRAMKEPRMKKVDLLRTKLSEPKRKLHEFEPLSLPLDPTKQVVGIIPSKNVFYDSKVIY